MVRFDYLLINNIEIIILVGFIWIIVLNRITSIIGLIGFILLIKIATENKFDNFNLVKIKFDENCKKNKSVISKFVLDVVLNVTYFFLLLMKKFIEYTNGDKCK